LEHAQAEAILLVLEFIALQRPAREEVINASPTRSSVNHGLHFAGAAACPKRIIDRSGGALRQCILAFGSVRLVSLLGEKPAPCPSSEGQALY
jgi:hypothetical protein